MGEQHKEEKSGNGEERLKTLEEAMIEHRVRLENGTKVFADVRDDISSMRADMRGLETRLAPKPMDWWKIIVGASGLLIAVLSGWWALSQRLSERPTEVQVERSLKAHSDSTGHPSLAGQLTQVRDTQIEQSTLLKVVGEDVKEIKADLKRATSRAPSR